MILTRKYVKKSIQLIKNLFESNTPNLVYIIEDANWSIKWDGYYICQGLNSQNLINSKLKYSPLFLKNKILHFGYSSLLLGNTGFFQKIHPSNKIILTWFHLSPDDERTKWIPLLNERVDLVHTSCNITKNSLIKFGLKKEKIHLIPLGIDLKLFRKIPKEIKNALRIKLKLPKNKLIIGSFQKDGNGWGEGLDPKWIKGPDLFCEAVNILSKKHDIHVLLTGPARGYVKTKLNQLGIPFTHYYIKDYKTIPQYYNVLDLYLITSRVEGGPKALLECMATGIPIVSTRVGMSPDVIKHNKNGILCNTMDAAKIAQETIRLINNPSLKDIIINNALETVISYDWKIISKRYYFELYEDLYPL